MTFNKTTGVLSGNPTTGGVFKLTFSAKAGTAKAVTQAFTLTVPLFISTASLASVKPGAKYSATLKASGGKSPYTWAVTKALPSGLKLSTAGVISGTLAKTVKAGKYPVDLKVGRLHQEGHRHRRIVADGYVTISGANHHASHPLPLLPDSTRRQRQRSFSAIHWPPNQ